MSKTLYERFIIVMFGLLLVLIPCFLFWFHAYSLANNFCINEGFKKISLTDLRCISDNSISSLPVDCPFSGWSFDKCRWYEPPKVIEVSNHE